MNPRKLQDSNFEKTMKLRKAAAGSVKKVFTKKPIAAHPKLITGKESKRWYRQRYRLPFMTRSEARKERAAAGLKAVADDGLAMALDIIASANDLVMDGDSNGGPGPSTLANVTKKTNLAAKADPIKDTDTPAPGR